MCVLYSVHYNDTVRASKKYFYYAQNPDDATQKPIAFRNETVTYRRIQNQYIVLKSKLGTRRNARCPTKRTYLLISVYAIANAISAWYQQPCRHDNPSCPTSRR